MKILFNTLQAISFSLIAFLPNRAWSIDYEFLLFPEINVSVEGYDNPHFDINPGIDFFASVRYQDFSLIAEYFLNKNESELERLLVGWDASDSINLWIGRHHNYIGYWNTEFHHGAFLETSITRPAITEFEDDGGILPTHVTGLAGEFNHSLGNGLLRVSTIIGLGPVYLKNRELAAFDILSPDTDDHDGAFSVRITYFPENYESNQVGFSIGGDSIPSTDLSTNQIEQLSFRPFINWQISDLRLIGELNYVFNKVDRPANSFNADIVAGYLQAELSVDPNWTIFARYEGTEGQKRNLSIIFPDYINDRQVAGVRFDLGKQNAFKLEIGRKREFNRATAEVRIQWSAVFP